MTKETKLESTMTLVVARSSAMFIAETVSQRLKQVTNQVEIDSKLLQIDDRERIRNRLRENTELSLKLQHILTQIIAAA